MPEHLARDTVIGFLIGRDKALIDLKQIYGEKSLIVKETSAIADGMRNNLSPEELFGDFASRSGQKDIRTFADTFRVCNRSGGCG